MTLQFVKSNKNDDNDAEAICDGGGKGQHAVRCGQDH